MATLTFDEIHARVAAFHTAEAARNAPEAVARRAVFTLRSGLPTSRAYSPRSRASGVLRSGLAGLRRRTRYDLVSSGYHVSRGRPGPLIR